jgi:hypothetical protein
MSMESYKHAGNDPFQERADEIDDEAFDRWMPRDF